MTVEWPGGSATLPVPVVGHASELAFSDRDVVIIAVKSQDTEGVLDAVAGVARVPAVYGAAAAALTLALGIRPPGAVMAPIGLLSEAAVPMMILVLGMQLERAARPREPRVVAAAVVISMILTPLVAMGIAHLIGLRGAAFQAGVLQTSMPTAVITTILAVEFDVLPDFVTSVVFASTLLSPLTVTLMIAYLQTV